MTASCLASFLNLIHFQNYNEMALLFFVMLYNFCTKIDTGNKVKYCGLPKNMETQQENVKKNTKETTVINWDKGRICL